MDQSQLLQSASPRYIVLFLANCRQSQAHIVSLRGMLRSLGYTAFIDLMQKYKLVLSVCVRRCVFVCVAYRSVSRKRKKHGEKETPAKVTQIPIRFFICSFLLVLGSAQEPSLCLARCVSYLIAT